MADVDDAGFRDAVRLAALVDPMPTLRRLAEHTGLGVDEVVHYALTRYASSGAEALLAVEPQALRELIEARRAENWTKVAGIVDWLESGLDSDTWR